MKLYSTILIVLTLLAKFSFGQLHTFKNFSHKDGLNMASIQSISQCENGLIWIGTDGADLVTFDGLEFEEIKFEPEFQDHHFSSLLHRNDTLLFASSYKGFFLFEKKTKKLEHLFKGDATCGNSLAVVGDQRGYYFISQYLISFGTKGKVKTLKRFKDSETPLAINETISLNKGYLLLTNKGPLYLNGGKIISFNDWTQTDTYNAEEFTHGYLKDDEITLLNNRADRWLTILLNKSHKPSKIKEYNDRFVLDEGEIVVSVASNNYSYVEGLLTSSGNIFKINNRELDKIVLNYPNQIQECHQIVIDLNGDFWVASFREGLYKISNEPFTKIRLNPLYESRDIMLMHRTFDQRIIISRSNNKTYIGSIISNDGFVELPYSTRSIHSKNKETYYLGTTEGVKTYIPGNRLDIRPFLFPNEQIHLVFEEGDNLWIGIKNKGLIKYNLVTKAITDITKEGNYPQHFYTVQKLKDVLYFGTNSGIFKYEKGKLEFVETDMKAGSYVGNSCKDSYGNIWFTREKGIQVFLQDGTNKLISNKYFPSNLLYTLQADNYGNVLVGSNKGITLLEVSRNGSVLSSDTYSANRGFTGYETNMRSQFKIGNQLYVGTIEGLFLINTSLLTNLKAPYSPVVTPILEDTNTDSTSDPTNEYKFKLAVYNAKDNELKFNYRIKGVTNNWTRLSPSDKGVLTIRNLPTGNYTLEVVASYDGLNYSEPTLYHFKAKRPFWQSSWFIIFIIALIVLINILLIVNRKRFDAAKLLNIKEAELDIQMAPETILFAILFHGGSLLFGTFYYNELNLSLGLLLSISFILIALFFLSINAKNAGQKHLYKYYLIAGLSVITLHFFIEAYLSNLHPFHIIGLIITGSIAPFVLSKLRQSIGYSLIVFFTAICVALLVTNPIYPKTYFLIATFASSSLIIFNSYLRNNSIEKLLFVSGIVNNGNMPVIAFNNNGKVTFASENIKHFINITSNALVDNNISALNHYITFDEGYKEHDITQEFDDNDTYLVPMMGTDKKVRWIEWKYRKYNKELNIIIGQDVSEKIEVKNTHDLLVQNVEDLIFTIDFEGYFTFCNDSFLSKLGYKKEELMGTYSIDVVAEEFREKANKFYSEHFRKKKKSSYLELPIVKKNGEVIWIGQYVNTVFAPGSQIYIESFISLARDITEDRRKQQIIKEQRDDIRSSINYAKKIQMNLLSKRSHFDNNFSDYFILIKPKDIVSGDFYWTNTIGDLHIVVLADCTGHGVPGAFMTLLGINLLNTIVGEAKITEPSIVLNEMDSRLNEYLNSQDSEQKVNDGMEVTILVIDTKTNDVSYACAGSRFLVNSNGNFTMHKGNNEHLGGHKPDVFNGYYTQYTTLSEDDTVYLFTDGYQDQFGGIKDKKYSFRRLLELFDLNSNLPMKEQKIMYEEEFDQWKGEMDQTDDVTIIGFKSKRNRN